MVRSFVATRLLPVDNAILWADSACSLAYAADLQPNMLPRFVDGTLTGFSGAAGRTMGQSYDSGAPPLR